MFENKREHHLWQFKTSEEYIYYLTIKNLNWSKTHWWENISIKMINISGNTIALLKKLLGRNFHIRIKKSTTVPIHRKDREMLTVNYWPIRVLPIFSKACGRFFYFTAPIINSWNMWIIWKQLTTWCKRYIPSYFKSFWYTVIWRFITQIELLWNSESIYRTFERLQPRQ